MWHARLPSTAIATLVSVLTLTQEKPRQLSECYFIPECHIKLVRFMMVLPQWIGWSRSRSAELPLPLQPLLVFGVVWILSLKIIVSILLILLGTSTSLLRLSALCGYLMVQSLCYADPQVCSRRLKQYGVKQTNMKCREWYSSTKWIVQVLTIYWLSSNSKNVLARCQSHYN